MIAAGKEADVVRFLDWTASRKLTVLRVLVMAKHLFALTPEAGRAALPRLLDLASARGLAVEVVALADTAGSTVDFDTHIREVGRIASEKGNAFVEIANEPGHATQDRRLHDPAEVQRLAQLLPEPLIVALGSAEYDEKYMAADYATFHFPRHAEWAHVLGLAEGSGLLARAKKPLINDEPIGASAEYQPGRRDNSLERFGAAGALGQFVGMGSTFHYEGGLQARPPDQRETACLDAWQQGLELTRDVALGEWLGADDVARRLGKVTGGRGAFGRHTADRAAVLVIDPPPNTTIDWSEGWIEERRATAPGALLVTATRRR